MKISVALLNVFFIFTLSLPAQNAHSLPDTSYKLSVSYYSSLMPVNDQYVLELDGTDEKVTIDTGTRSVVFAKKFHKGDRFKIRIISSPRPCNLNYTTGADSTVQGAFDEYDVYVLLSCNVSTTLVKVNVTGIEAGETFSFKDDYGRTYTLPFSHTVTFGIPVGDQLRINQTSGPRFCTITPNNVTVTENGNEPMLVSCDCSIKETAGPPPANKYDLVTRSTDNKITNTYYESGDPVIAGKGEDEGRYVAFWMYGKNIDGSSGNYRQVYWRDRKTGITKMISKNAAGAEGNANSGAPAIAADGQTVVFESYASNLSDGDANGVRDVFMWDATTNTVELVSRVQGNSANGESYEPVISGDGKTIVYTSNASNILTLEPVFSTPNIYVFKRNSGQTFFITKDYETKKAAGGYSPSISDDGSKIAFCAYTSHLAQNDNNNLWDIFLWQSGSSLLKRISLTAAGGERNQGDESSSRVVWPSISGDGNTIVFATTSDNIVPDDHNGVQDIFLYNIPAETIKRVSTAGTAEGDGNSPVGQGERIGISYNGTWITYNTNASNLGVPKGNIIKQNTQTGEIIPVTKITSGSTARPMISRYGNYVVTGCSEQYDHHYSSSGIFTIYTGKIN